MYITILVTLSRPEAIDLVMDQLAVALEDPYDYELVIAVDNRLIGLTDLNVSVRKLFPNRFRHIDIVSTKNPSPRKFNIPGRRDRISALHILAKGFIGSSDLVFCFEDDTVLPEHVVSKLVKTWEWEKLSSSHKVGYLEGVQVGRWGTRYIGAWDQLEDGVIVSKLPTGDPVDLITGGGFYCFITPTELYKSAPFTWEEPMGPDFHYGVWLKAQGYSSFIDWGVQCGHVTNKEVIYPNGTEVALKVKLVGNRVISSVK